MNKKLIKAPGIFYCFFSRTLNKHYVKKTDGTRVCRLDGCGQVLEPNSCPRRHLATHRGKAVKEHECERCGNRFGRR